MAATAGVPAAGTLFKYDAGGGSYTTVAECQDISGPDLGADTTEMTNHDSPTAGAGFLPWKEFVGGLAEGGEVTLDLNFLTGNATHSAILNKLGSKTKTSYRIVFPAGGAGATWTFDAFVTKFSPKAPIGDRLSAAVSFRVTGIPVFS